MSKYFNGPVTEGYVAQVPEDHDRPWNRGQYVYPNQGPFYSSESTARREARGGRVFKVTVVYEEVPQ